MCNVVIQEKEIHFFQECHSEAEKSSFFRTIKEDDKNPEAL